MKNLNQVLILGAFFSGVVLSAPSVMAQQKMNTDTQDLVIKKMERVLSALEKGDSAYIASQQRLADLLSERARTRFMSEIEANCDGCKGSKDDRKKAIGIYEALLKEVKINEHGVILFQLAHLYEMAGQTDKAIALYEKILKEAKAQKTATAIVSRSRAGLGDLLFQTGKFNEALSQYNTALKDKNLDNRALTIYNKAWCEFNTDKLNSAIVTMETLLKNPQSISRSTDGTSKYDPVFHADIQRDLATFYSRRAITDKEIATYDGLIPSGKRKELMLHFADEADRVGQKQAAHKILSRYLEDPELTKEERLAGFIKLAQVNYDRGQSTQSTSDFAKAAAAFQKNGCESEETCKEHEKMMKRYVTELHRSKKVKPDQDLLNAYITYQNTFPNDIEMTERGATVASDIGNFAVATQLYRTISETKGFSDKDRQNALLNEISVAEKTKNPVIQKEAYLHFLKYSSDEKKNFEVRYQLAYLAYQQKQLAEAADAFTDLARQKDGNADLRLKSANLALDALAQMKDDARIEVWASDYATMFPSSRKEFLAVAHKALMNRAANVANSSESSQRDLKKVLSQVSDSKNIGTTPQEQILFYTNQSVLAKKAGDDETYVNSLRSLLAISALSAGKREDTLSALAAHYEKKLDFKNAYIISTKMAQGKEAAKDREFRLGTLADLAEMNPEKHYRASLKAGLSGAKAMTLRARLVTLSKSPASELKAQSSELKQKPALLNEMTIYVYAKTGSKNSVKSVLEMKEMRRQSAGLFIEKQDFYGKVSAFQNRISALKLETKTDRLLAKTMADRISALGQADKLLAESLRLKDVTSQMMMLTVIGQENERMVHDLAGLPMPKGLTPAEEKQYVTILKGKSKPFLMKARMSQQKQQEIWAQSPALAQLVKDYKTTRPEVQRLLAREMQILVQLPGSGKMKSEISGALSESSFSARELQSARKNVSENPENIRDLENLKFIETKIGHPLMPSYLDARLNTLQKGKSL